MNSLCAQSHSEAAMLEMYAPVVRRIATGLQRMRPAYLDRDDALQDGMIGLLRAIRANRYGVEGDSFVAYLSAYVRGAIIDSYRSVGGISHRDYARAKAIMRQTALGHAVAPAEKDMAQAIMVAAWVAAEPLDGDGALGVADPYPGPEQRLMTNQLLRQAVDALQEVSARDRNIFIACELGGDKQVDIAARFDISVGRISQIVKAVRRHLIDALA